MSDLVFSIIAAVVGIVGTLFGFVSFFRNKKFDDKDEGEKNGILYTEVGYIKAGIDDLKRDNRELRNDIQELHDRIVRNEESCKQAHKRIDTLSLYHQPN